jgi:dipeptidyl aminopeptidase/acylaminoacyl peptidase
VPLLLQSVIGFTPSNNLSLYQSSSPINYALQQSPPTLLIHGGADQIVPSSQSVLLKDKLAGLNVPHQFVFYPNGGHGDWDAATYKDAFEQLQAFLQQHIP